MAKEKQATMDEYLSSVNRQDLSFESLKAANSRAQARSQEIRVERERASLTGKEVPWDWNPKDCAIRDLHEQQYGGPGWKSIRRGDAVVPKK